MKIIEVNGDYWHANPNMYEADWVHPASGLTARDIWTYDQHKLSVAVDRGFQIMTVWENEINEDIERVLDAATRFFNG